MIASSSRTLKMSIMHCNIRLHYNPIRVYMSQITHVLPVPMQTADTLLTQQATEPHWSFLSSAKSSLGGIFTRTVESLLSCKAALLTFSKSWLHWALINKKLPVFTASPFGVQAKANHLKTPWEQPRFFSCWLTWRRQTRWWEFHSRLDLWSVWYDAVLHNATHQVMMGVFSTLVRPCTQPRYLNCWFVRALLSVSKHFWAAALGLNVGADSVRFWSAPSGAKDTRRLWFLCTLTTRCTSQSHTFRNRTSILYTMNLSRE